MSQPATLASSQHYYPPASCAASVPRNTQSFNVPNPNSVPSHPAQHSFSAASLHQKQQPHPTYWEDQPRHYNPPLPPPPYEPQPQISMPLPPLRYYSNGDSHSYTQEGNVGSPGSLSMYSPDLEALRENERHFIEAGIFTDHRPAASDNMEDPLIPYYPPDPDPVPPLSADGSYSAWTISEPYHEHSAEPDAFLTDIPDSPTKSQIVPESFPLPHGNFEYASRSAEISPVHSGGFYPPIPSPRQPAKSEESPLVQMSLPPPARFPEPQFVPSTPQFVSSPPQFVPSPVQPPPVYAPPNVAPPQHMYIPSPRQQRQQQQQQQQQEHHNVTPPEPNYDQPQTPMQPQPVMQPMPVSYQLVPPGATYYVAAPAFNTGPRLYSHYDPRHTPHPGHELKRARSFSMSPYSHKEETQPVTETLSPRPRRRKIEQTAEQPLRPVLKGPKKPVSVWQLYFTDFVSEHRRRAPHERIDVSKEAKDAAVAYARLPDSEKEVYIERAEQAKKEYERQFAEWQRTLRPEEIRAENLFRTQQRREQKSRKSNLRDPNAPKKPLSAYFLFQKQVRETPDLKAKVYGDVLETTQQSKLAAAFWRLMTDEQKQPYLDTAERQKREYEEARKVYEDIVAQLPPGSDLSGIWPADGARQHLDQKRGSPSTSARNDQATNEKVPKQEPTTQ